MNKYLLITCLFSLLLICCDDNIPTQSVGPTGENHHSSNITSNESWTSDKSHFVDSEIYIQNAILKIEPGTTVKFKQGAAINVMDSSAIIADGTEAPIRFNREDDQQGHWKYIYLAGNSIDDSCRFINCQFDFGGGGEDWTATIYCQNASPTIINSSITNSASSGIYLAGDCSSAKLIDNTITNNGGTPITTAVCNVPTIGAGNYIGNDRDFIRIVDGSINTNMTWINHEIPYTIADDLYIENTALTLDVGTVIHFESHKGLYVTENGSLLAESQIDNPIIFSGNEPEKGFWDCIYFGNTSNGRLQNCVIEYGGNDWKYPANIYIDSPAPMIENCTIRYSSQYGIFVNGERALSDFVNNVVTANDKAPLSVSAMSVPAYQGNRYEGNGENCIVVRGGPVDGLINQTSYWENLGINFPYQLDGYVLIRGGTLHIEKGLKIEMSAGAHIDIMEGGGLIADGSSQLITFTGVDKYPGSWNNIYFSNYSNDERCLLKHCLIEFGGSNSNKPANIYCENASPTITNCVIENSLSYGIYLAGNSNPILINNIYNNNLRGPKYP